MKYLFLLFAFAFTLNGFSQKEEIRVPRGVVYKYCKPKKYQKIKDLLLKELVMVDPTYSMVKESFFMGPVLWDRLSKVDSLKETKAIKVDLYVDNSLLEGRFYNDHSQAKVIWNHIRSEFNGTPMRLRKATPEELVYYWTVINFDIEEPLIIGETPSHKYIFDIDLKKKSLLWLDEMPQDLETWLEELK